MAILATDKKRYTLAACIVGGTVVLSFVAQAWLGNFPKDIFCFPLNILILAMWMMQIIQLYRNRATSAVARFMLSRNATWLTLALMALIGISLGLERKPSATSWPVAISLLFIQSHLCLVVIRGWRSAKGIRWRFCLTHIGLLLALGAGFWGAPDREQLRIATHHYPSNEAYTMEGEHRFLPYIIELDSFCIQQSKSGAHTHYEAQIKVDDSIATLKVNHPYERTLTEKIYLVSFGTSPYGETYAVIEIVNEPWQWLSATGIIMLIAGAVLLFIQGPKNGKRTCGA